ncbi:uncharacterized protein C8A04DRAFT_33142 [Dichotomopilus funicola]|uniref:DUF167 domain-containing protein n=1 Tax=Dichotomopilus funicola TaxID=1934379 RepID=A0AAN6UV51_9PEZI|nr:hypothetical protein C8A04DRAFT_33142 [Dichotomopilus funicola]
MASRAIWYELAAKQAARNTLFLRCDITTGAPTSRQGIIAITEPAIKISVAAPARERRANHAVVKVLAEALNLRESNVQIIRGIKSRVKTFTAQGWWIDEPGEDRCLRRVLEYLEEARLNGGRRR